MKRQGPPRQTNEQHTNTRGKAMKTNNNRGARMKNAHKKITI